MNYIVSSLRLMASQREALRQWLRDGGSRLHMRAQILLYAAAGERNTQIAKRLGASRDTVIDIRRRFANGGLAEVETVRGCRRNALMMKVVGQMKTQLSGLSRRCSTYQLAQKLQVSQSTAYRVLKAAGIRRKRWEAQKRGNQTLRNSVGYGKSGRWVSQKSQGRWFGKELPPVQMDATPHRVTFLVSGLQQDGRETHSNEGGSLARGGKKMSFDYSKSRASRQGILGSRAAFSLVELLVVMTIISILAAMLLPALRNAQEASRQTLCGSQLRQLYVPVSAYAEDYRGLLFNGFASDEGAGLNVWQSKLVTLGYWDAGGSRKVRGYINYSIRTMYAMQICPSAKPHDEGSYASDYSANWYVMPSKGNLEGRPNGNLFTMAPDTVLFYDGTGVTGYPGNLIGGRARCRHSERMETLWADAHVSGAWAGDVDTMTYGTKFITPEAD